MNTKFLSISMIIIGLMLYSAYPFSLIYKNALPDWAVFLLVSLGVCLAMLAHLLKYYSHKLILYLFFIFGILSLSSFVIKNITLWFWLISAIAILFHWYYKKKYKKKYNHNDDKVANRNSPV